MVDHETPQLNSVFHALGDATRRRMLRELASGERTVGQLAEPFAISLAAASKHIKALENAGLIRREVRGRTHLCRLDPGPLASADQWLSFYERFWTDRLDVLERLLRYEDARQSPTPEKERTDERTRNPRRLRRADRARHAEDPAPSARPHRARLGLSHRERPAPPVAGGGPDGDEGRRALRTRLAQRRADRSARRASARLLRRAPDAEPDHRARSAPQARHRLGNAAAAFRSSSSRRATRCCSP